MYLAFFCSAVVSVQCFIFRHDQVTTLLVLALVIEFHVPRSAGHAETNFVIVVRQTAFSCTSIDNVISFFTPQNSYTSLTMCI